MTDKDLLKDLHYLSNFNQAGNLEVYHWFYNKICLKRLRFSIHGVISGTMIGVRDHNFSANLPQTTKSDVTLRYKQRLSWHWCIKKNKCAKEKEYVQDHLEEVFLQKSSGACDKLPGTPKMAEI